MGKKVLDWEIVYKDIFGDCRKYIIPDRIIEPFKCIENDNELMSVLYEQKVVKYPCEELISFEVGCWGV